LIPESQWRGAGNKFSAQDAWGNGEVYEAELETIGDNIDEIDNDDEMEEDD
jgi:hypothetical protein